MTNARRRRRRWAIIVLVATGGTSCADAPADVRGGTVAPETASPEAAAPAATGRAVPADDAPNRTSWVVDSRGHPLPASVARARVVSLVPSLTEIVVAVGGAAQLVGRTRFDEDPRIEGVPAMGGSLDPDVEAILAARPDLVITWADVDARALTTRLESFGLPVYAAGIGPIGDFERHARALGTLLGRAAAGDSLVRSVQAGLAAVACPRDGAGPPNGVDTPVVLFVAWPGPIMTSGGGTFVDELIRLVGARGAFDDVDEPWPVVSLESVLERDPDLVLVASEGAAAGAAGRIAVRIRRDPRWRALDAVREGRAHAVDSDLFTRPGPHMVRAASELARHVRALRDDCR